jgi:uncharacterized protein (UPF0276 family)
MEQVCQRRPAVDFFEVHPENYVLDQAGLRTLETVRNNYPLSLHAVGLSLGSAEGIDRSHLAALRCLVDRLDPFLISDHLSWSTADGIFLNDLLPLPLTQEALDVIARNIDEIQTALRRPLLIENPSAYMAFRDNEFDEPEFLRILVARTGCELLLDVNNVFVSATNLGFAPDAYLRAFPVEAVREIHVSGHQRKEIDGETVLIDDHGSAVSSPVWALYADAVSRTNTAASAIEWDTNIPALNILLREREKARAVIRSVQTKRPAPPLDALQSRMAKALLSGNADAFEGQVTGHFSVYRSNVRESLTAALRSVYVGVEALVGEAFFRQAALQFIAINPPRMPSIAGYGEEFPEFLDGLPSCRGLPYLGDVARLEWCASRTCLEPQARSLAPDALRAFATADTPSLCFDIRKDISYLSSAYPIDEIWQFARAGGEGTPPSIEGGPVFIEIGRGEDSIVIRRLEEAEFRFRHALEAGADLGSAAEIAVRADPLFDLAAALRFALRDGICTDCRIGQSHYEEVRSCQH